MDVRCDCERLRHELKNPRTTPYAESSQHSALLFDQRPRSARAAGKWSLEKYPTTTASTPYVYNIDVDRLYNYKLLACVNKHI